MKKRKPRIIYYKHSCGGTASGYAFYITNFTALAGWCMTVPRDVDGNGIADIYEMAQVNGWNGLYANVTNAAKVWTPGCWGSATNDTELAELGLMRTDGDYSHGAGERRPVDSRRVPGLRLRRRAERPHQRPQAPLVLAQRDIGGGSCAGGYDVRCWHRGTPIFTV